MALSLLAARRPLDLLADSAPSLSGSGGPSLEAVTWTQIVGCTVDAPNTLRRTAAGGAWNAGACSTRAIASGNGYVEATMATGLPQAAFGLANGNTNSSYDDIDFGVTWATGGGTVYRVRNAGVAAIAGLTLIAGDVVRVEVVGADIQIKVNGSIKYTWVAPAISYPLLCDASTLAASAKVQGATLYGTLGASGY